MVPTCHVCKVLTLTRITIVFKRSLVESGIVYLSSVLIYLNDSAFCLFICQQISYQQHLTRQRPCMGAVILEAFSIIQILLYLITETCREQSLYHVSSSLWSISSRTLPTSPLYLLQKWSSRQLLPW